MNRIHIPYKYAQISASNIRQAVLDCSRYRQYHVQIIITSVASMAGVCNCMMDIVHSNDGPSWQYMIPDVNSGTPPAMLSYSNGSTIYVGLEPDDNVCNFALLGESIMYSTRPMVMRDYDMEIIEYEPAVWGESLEVQAPTQEAMKEFLQSFF